MPYEYADHLKCKDCGRSGCYFYVCVVEGKGYLTNKCRECQKQRYRDFYHKNKKRLAIAHALYRQKNRDRVLEWKRQYFQRSKLKRRYFEEPSDVILLQHV